MEPCIAEILDRATHIQFDIDTKQYLARHKIKARPTTIRKKTAVAFPPMLSASEIYTNPEDHGVFEEKLKKAFGGGIKLTKECI